MANTATNVTTGRPRTTGSVHKAPAGTQLPTDASTALASAFTSLGYISEDGLSVTRSFDSDEIKDWGGQTVLTLESNYSDRFKFTLIEALNVDVLKAVHGASAVSGTLSTGITVSVQGAEHEACVWAIDMIMRGGVLKRIVIPNGAITEVGEVVYSGEDAVGYEVTVTAMADSSGKTSYEYIKAPTTTGGGT